MQCRLEGIDDWEERARRALYHVDTLALGAGVTTEALRVHWWKQRRCCTKMWLEYLRALDALGLLSAGRQIKDVASMVGFQHRSHFSRAFFAAFKLSPKDHACLLIGRPPALNFSHPQLAKMVHLFSWSATNLRLTSNAQQDGPSHTQNAAYENRVSPTGLIPVPLQLLRYGSSAPEASGQRPSPPAR